MFDYELNEIIQLSIEQKRVYNIIKEEIENENIEYKIPIESIYNQKQNKKLLNKEFIEETQYLPSSSKYIGGIEFQKSQESFNESLFNLGKR